jgi:DegV family protein with EDD domain
MNAERTFENALQYGYERLAAWSDLLDRINVFPVADADTGTNLKISLAPLRRASDSPKGLVKNLMLAATGNSGNIAAAFFCEFIKARQIDDLPSLISTAKEKARQSVADPQPGTMLTVFDALAKSVANGGWHGNTPNCPAIISHLEEAVSATPSMLPVLQQAGVIDAGALGMFIFLEAYFAFLFDPDHPMRPVTEIFPDKLTISADWSANVPEGDYCISTLIESNATLAEVQRNLAQYGHSVVLSGDQDHIKVHMHTDDLDRLHRHLSSLGNVAQWSEETMSYRPQTGLDPQKVHIVTDAAGSFTLEDAKTLDVTLLNSYLVVGDQVYPETMYDPQKLYAAMAGGTKVTTAQASGFERHQSYESATRLHERVLYLCVGSVYTGNFQVATAWQAEQDLGRRMAVIDTGAASGRLGIVALATARYAREASSPDEVLAFARKAVGFSQEYVFLDQLKYLAAGGRISKTKGFFGDLLHFKPIISPRAEGAVKVGVVRNRQEQVKFSMDRLAEAFGQEDTPMILLQYSDDRSWVEEVVLPNLASAFPKADIVVRPLSLTSGAHMGPGTWALAFLPSPASLAATA